MSRKPKANITNLHGDALFEALLGSRPVINEEVAAERRVALIDPWKDTALVLLIHISVCETCGTEHRSPNRFLFIKREHARRGTHYHSLEGIENLADRARGLPRATEQHSCTVPVCESCLLSADLRRFQSTGYEEPIPTWDNPPTGAPRVQEYD